MQDSEKIIAIREKIEKVLAMQDISEAISCLDVLLKERSLKRTILLNLKTRQRSLNGDKRKGIVSYSESKVTQNQIIEAFCELLKDLDENDIDANKLETSESRIEKKLDTDLESPSHYQNLVTPALVNMEANFRKGQNKNLFGARAEFLSDSDCFVAEFCFHKIARLETLRGKILELIDELHKYDVRKYSFLKVFRPISTSLFSELDKRAFLIINNSRHGLSKIIFSDFEDLISSLEEFNNLLRQFRYSNNKDSVRESRKEVQEKLKKIEYQVKSLCGYLNEIGIQANREFFGGN
ncbi:MAG: hypothetical protein H6566_29650 [Lewinellaceae bacterium]|nr:hypothetical protein [Lewinellaceae bacterium]